MHRKLSFAAGLLSLSGAGCDVTPERQCGDGRCSEVSKDEAPTDTMPCWNVALGLNASTHVLTATDHGRIMLAGEASVAPSASLGWVAALDLSGALEWDLHLDAGVFVEALRPYGSGFLGLTSGPAGAAVIEVNGSGELIGSIPLPSIDGALPGPNDLLVTPSGVLLAGSLGEDLWLARWESSGQLETLMREDVAGLGLHDRFVQIVGDGQQIGLLAIAGRAAHGDGDSIAANTDDVHLLVYAQPQPHDDALSLISRTVLSSGEARVSLSGQSLAIHDGRWFIAGSKLDPTDATYGSYGWAAAVEDGELAWTFETGGAADSGKPWPHAKFVAAALGSTGAELLLIGRIATATGTQRWAVGLAADDGDLNWERIGDRRGATPKAAFDSYAHSSTTSHTIWLSGVTQSSEGANQWLCKLTP